LLSRTAVLLGSDVERLAPRSTHSLLPAHKHGAEFAVFELIDDLRDAIWQCYNIQLIDEFRDQLKPDLVNCTEKEPDDPPF
jgi:hypothetical protein